MIKEDKKLIIANNEDKKNQINTKRKHYSEDIKELACRMKKEGYSEKFITRLTKASSGTRAKWHAEYNKSQKEGYIKKTPLKKGRPTKVKIEKLDSLVSKNRQLNGKQMCLLYNNQNENKVCANTILKAIKNLKYNKVKGSKRYYEANEEEAAEYQKKLNVIIEASRKKNSNIVICFQDETSFTEKCFIINGLWKKPGEIVFNKESGRIQYSIAYSGTINATTGKTYPVLWPNTYFDSDVYIATMRLTIPQIQKDNPGKMIIVFIDNASFHTTSAVLALQIELNFKFEFLPVRNPHLNKQESVNSYLKREINNFYTKNFNEIHSCLISIENLLYNTVSDILNALANRNFFTS